MNVTFLLAVVFYSDGSSTPRARRSPVERPSNPVPKPRPMETIT